MLFQTLFKLNKTIGLLLIATMFVMNGIAHANVVGNGTQNFAPTTGFHDFATVNSSDTIPGRSFHLGLFVNNASNTLPYGQDVEGDSKKSNQLTGADLIFGYGVTDRLHLAVSTPFIVNQQMDDDSNTHSQFAKEGNTEFRFHCKFKLLGKRDHSGLAFLLNATMDRTSENPHRGENFGLTYVPELAADLKIKSFLFSANLGYKIQDKGEVIEGALFEPFGNKILYSAAAGLLVNKKRTKLYVEIYGDRPVGEVSTDSDRKTESLESLLGAKHLVKEDLSLNIGAGTEMVHGVATPDLRIFAGLNYLISPAPKATRKIAKAKPFKKKKKFKARKKRRMLPPPVIDVQEDTVAAADLGLLDPQPVVAAPSTAPSTAPLPLNKPDEVIVINNVNFLFDSDHEVFKGGLQEIDKVAKYVSDKQSAAKIVIEGHTCFMGTDSYNEDLSYRRAKTIRMHLINNYGFRPDQVIAVGFGESRPVTTNVSEQGRRLNRRVEFKIYYADTLSQVGY